MIYLLYRLLGNFYYTFQYSITRPEHKKNMSSNARNPNHGVPFASLRPLRDRLMRAGYVLVSEERESGSEYSGSTCCCCSSCASSCSCEEYSDADDSEEEEDGESDDDEIVIEEAEVVEEEEGYWSDCSACWARRRERERRGRMGRRFGNRYMNVARAAEGRDVSDSCPVYAFFFMVALVSSRFSFVF